MPLTRLVGAASFLWGLLLVGQNLPAAEPAKLVVVVSVDQLCQEYFQRFEGNLTDDGFYRLVQRSGANYVNCHHAHAFTLTGPGHATQLSGTHPSLHGIIGNDWFDRATGKKLYCVSDPDVTTIGAIETQGPCSPKNLLATTVGDMLKVKTHKEGKVIGVALKDRAAILMTGRTADAAYWFEEGEGVWVTSSYYRDDLPGYIRAFNSPRYADKFAEREWKLLYDSKRYQHHTADDFAAENPPSGFGRAFPHKLAAGGKELFGQLRVSPFGNEMTFDVAREVVTHEQLGQDDVPDLLCINLSSNDYIGHAYGPHSLEVEDVTYRTDLQLRAFYDWLGEHLKHPNFVLIITADHGVCPLPEFMEKQGLVAGRNPLGATSKVYGEMEALLRAKLSLEEKPKEALVQYVEPNQVYLQHAQLEGEQLRAARVLLRDWLLKQPGIYCAATYDELATGSVNGPLRDALLKTFHPQRSGDVLWIYDPYFICGDKGTTHGSPWGYDTHVPMLLVGAGIKAGQYHRRVSPANIGPTLAELFGIDPPPSCFEQPLDEALVRE